MLQFFSQRSRFVVPASVFFLFFVRKLKYGLATNKSTFSSGDSTLRAQHGLDANSCFWLVNILFQKFDTSSKEEMEMIKAQILR